MGRPQHYNQQGNPNTPPQPMVMNHNYPRLGGVLNAFPQPFQNSPQVHQTGAAHNGQAQAAQHQQNGVYTQQNANYQQPSAAYHQLGQPQGHVNYHQPGQPQQNSSYHLPLPQTSTTYHHPGQHQPISNFVQPDYPSQGYPQHAQPFQPSQTPAAAHHHPNSEKPHFLVAPKHTVRPSQQHNAYPVAAAELQGSPIQDAFTGHNGTAQPDNPAASNGNVRSYSAGQHNKTSRLAPNQPAEITAELNRSRTQIRNWQIQHEEQQRRNARQKESQERENSALRTQFAEARVENANLREQIKSFSTQKQRLIEENQKLFDCSVPKPQAEKLMQRITALDKEEEEKENLQNQLAEQQRRYAAYKESQEQETKTLRDHLTSARRENAILHEQTITLSHRLQSLLAENKNLLESSVPKKQTETLTQRITALEKDKAEKEKLIVKFNKLAAEKKKIETQLKSSAVHIETMALERNVEKLEMENRRLVGKNNRLLEMNRRFAQAEGNTPITTPQFNTPVPQSQSSYSQDQDQDLGHTNLKNAEKSWKECEKEMMQEIERLWKENAEMKRAVERKGSYVEFLVGEMGVGGVGKGVEGERGD